MPIVELDRMVSAARPAILEIETNACENDDGRQYYSNMGTGSSSSMPAPVEAQNAPSLGGIEACWHLRALSSNVAIVMVTVREAEEDMVEALEAGADDYIVQPFRFSE